MANIGITNTAGKRMEEIEAGERWLRRMQSASIYLSLGVWLWKKRDQQPSSGSLRSQSSSKTGQFTDFSSQRRGALAFNCLCTQAMMDAYLLYTLSPPNSRLNTWELSQFEGLQSRCSFVMLHYMLFQWLQVKTVHTVQIAIAGSSGKGRMRTRFFSNIRVVSSSAASHLPIPQPQQHDLDSFISTLCMAYTIWKMQACLADDHVCERSGFLQTNDGQVSAVFLIPSLLSGPFLAQCYC